MNLILIFQGNSSHLHKTCNIFYVIFWTVVLIFIVVSCNTTFWPLYPQVSFLYPDKQGTPEEDQRIQQPKCFITTNNNKDGDNSLKNNTQNIAHQFRWITQNLSSSWQGQFRVECPRVGQKQSIHLWRWISHWVMNKSDWCFLRESPPKIWVVNFIDYHPAQMPSGRTIYMLRPV